MIKFFANVIGWFCLCMIVLLAIAYIFSPKGQESLNVEKQEEIQLIYWEDVLAEEAYNNETISECAKILDDIGIYNLGDGRYGSEIKSIYISCFDGGHTVIIGFDDNKIDDIFFYGNLVYSKEKGQLATVDWKERKLTYVDDYMNGMTVTLMD